MLDEDIAWDLALFAGLEWEDDRAILAPLVDAHLLWVGEEQCDAIAAPIIEQLWADDLRGDIERALREYGKAPAAAYADLERGPSESRLARAYVRQGAVDLSGEAMLPGRCLCCVEEMLGTLPAGEHEALVLGAAVTLVLQRQPEFGRAPRSEAELERARARIRSLAELARRSLPRLAAGLLDVEPAAVWQAARAERQAARAIRN